MVFGTVKNCNRISTQEKNDGSLIPYPFLSGN
jgi:hypothetical protein